MGVFKVSEYQYIRIKKGVIVESFVVEPNFDIKILLPIQILRAYK